jgi:hypothetical protein
MHTTNYYDTLILPSPDTTAADAQVPARPETVAGMTYQRLLASPYALTSDDIIFGIQADRHAIPDDARGPARMEYFSRGQACLRSSPLVKTLGWALHHDGQGRVALVDPASEGFEQLMADDRVTKRPGLRSKRG